eukprot:scaffold1990_cov196-Alexandrium_tamarense.AAC.8
MEGGTFDTERDGVCEACPRRELVVGATFVTGGVGGERMKDGYSCCRRCCCSISSCRVFVVR